MVPEYAFNTGSKFLIITVEGTGAMDNARD